MQIDQFLRRVSWRVRRRFRRAADNDPIVTVERPAAAAGKPPRPGRTGRAAAAFLATLAALGVAYGVVAALNSRAQPDAVAPVRP